MKINIAFDLYLYQRFNVIIVCNQCYSNVFFRSILTLNESGLLLLTKTKTIKKSCYFSVFCVLQICSLMRGGIAERGGVRVGHRIIEINSQSVVATPHEKIVHILSNAVGEVSLGNTIKLHTCLTT